MPSACLQLRPVSPSHHLLRPVSLSHHSLRPFTLFHYSLRPVLPSHHSFRPVSLSLTQPYPDLSHSLSHWNLPFTYSDLSHSNITYSDLSYSLITHSDLSLLLASSLRPVSPLLRPVSLSLSPSYLLRLVSRTLFPPMQTCLILFHLNLSHTFSPNYLDRSYCLLLRPLLLSLSLRPFSLFLT